jgi:hypothetical protein
VPFLALRVSALSQVMCVANRFEGVADSSWANSVLGVGLADAVTGKEQSRLIHPCSPFSTGPATPAPPNPWRTADL